MKKDKHCPKNQSLSEYIVLKLLNPYIGKGRNVKTDNFFTLIKLV